MSFGVQILNEFGEAVVQMDKPVMYAYSLGTTKDIAIIGTEGRSAAAAAGYATTSFGVVTEQFAAIPYTVELQHTYSRIASGGTGTFTAVTSSKVLIHPVLNLQIGDLVFYDIATYGLLCSYMVFYHGYTDTTPLGGYGICEIEGNNDIGYTVVSTREPIAAPSDNYGMQIFDASGTRIFDSRQNIFEIYDHFYISKLIFERILRENITVNFNLSESNIAFRVAAPNHTSFITFTGGYRAQVAIKKVDNSTISLSRIDNGGAQTGTLRELFWDTLIIVGK